jgi:hypothetical protein
MFDFRGWILRAEAFTTGLRRLEGQVQTETLVAPPLTLDALQRLEAAIPQPLPLPLRRFLREGSAHCACRYVWEPPAAIAEQLPEIFGGGAMGGGAHLCNAEELVDDCQACQEWATETWIAHFPEDKTLWLHAMPFASVRNGDYLGLDLSKGERDPPVVCLSHDDHSGSIASTFEAFLLAWERLCYIGPEIWLLDEFRDPRTGLLDSETSKAEQLRRLFGVSDLRRTLVWH